MILMEGKLVYDSWRTRNRLGARGPRSSCRSLLFRVGDLCVDLLMHVRRDDLHIVYGQIIRESGGTPVAGARVRLDPRGDTAVSDELGQFTVVMLCGGEGSVPLVIEHEGRKLGCRVTLGVEEYA